MLLLCADYVVRGAVRLAQMLGLSTLLIGLTVVAFGTSAPEFVTALTAALAATPDMALGNIVGSNIANLLLVLGVAAFVSPLVCSNRAISRDGMAMLAATAMFVALGLLSGFGQWHGVALVALLLIYIYFSYRAEHRASALESVHVQEAEEVTDLPESPWRAGMILIAGLIGILVGAELLVRGGAGLARVIGISETVIGLTLVAIGTSLPELATAIMAGRRNHGDVAIGNILGSNIFNLLAIGGGVAIITPLPMPQQILRFDIWVLLFFSILILLLLLGGRRLRRREGTVLIAFYVAYVAIQFGPLKTIGL